MYLHANAKLGLAGRLALVRAVEEGLSLKAAAAAFSVSPATAHRWWHRWLVVAGRRRCWIARAGRAAHRGSSHRSCRSGSAPVGARPVGVRAWLRLRPGSRIRPVWKVLKRAGISRPPKPVKEPANSYEWPCPGDLLHMDTSRYTRFLQPGHAVTGESLAALTQLDEAADTSRLRLRARDRRRPLRLAYVELHRDETAATVTSFVERALAYFKRHGVTPKRLVTDNAFTYVKNRSLRELLARNGIRHLTTEPYRPRTNGKVERFHQTMAREWAYGLAYRSHHQRNQALPHWLHHYNTQRPHSSLGDRAPISRVHHVRGGSVWQTV